MTPEEKKLLEDINDKLEHLRDLYFRTHFNDQDVFQNKVIFSNDVYLKKNIAFFGSNTLVGKQAAITAPSGGATVDSQARTAINSIISTLQALGLTS